MPDTYTLADAMREYPKAVEAVMTADGYEWMTNRHRVECWARPTIVGSHFRVAGDEATTDNLIAACVRWMIAEYKRCSDNDDMHGMDRIEDDAWWNIVRQHKDHPARALLRAVSQIMEADDVIQP